MNTKKVYVYSIIGLLILVTGIFIVNAIVDLNKSWHSADEILVTINNFNMTFQQAIDEGFLTAGTINVPDHNYIIETPNPGHSANNILVEIDGFTMTLQDVVDNHVLVEGTADSYSTETLGLGHIFTNLDQISIKIDAEEMTLQDAITNANFCNITYGDECGGELCINSGNIVCNGTCAGISYKPIDTSCGTNAKCDENQNCICNAGWDDCNNDSNCECAISYECPSYDLATMCWNCGVIDSQPALIKSRQCIDTKCSDNACSEIIETEILASQICPTGYTCVTPKCYPRICPECSSGCANLSF